MVFSFNSHTAAIAAGNNGIPVRMHGHEFGKASGMAPRARLVLNSLDFMNAHTFFLVWNKKHSSVTVT